MNWIRQLQNGEKLTLAACFAGYAVNSFDFMIYTFMIPTLVMLWHMGKSEAGLIATASLLSSAVGGWFAGVRHCAATPVRSSTLLARADEQSPA